MAAKRSSTQPTKRKKQQLPLEPKRKKNSKPKSKEKKKKSKKNIGGNTLIDSSKISEKHVNETSGEAKNDGNDDVQPATASQQLSFFIHQYQSANGVQLSSLELESLNDTCILDSFANDIGKLGQHIKIAFGSSWKEVLCEKQLQERKVDPGNPAVLIISLSALRSLELIREIRPLTKECHAAKLFSKHMKIDEQVSLLKNRVNIACGTPSRIKKLIDMEALGLSRLAVIVFDMHTDVKGYSLFTLPQVRDEFWDLYKTHFHHQLLEGGFRIFLYGRVPANFETKKRKLKLSEQ